MNNWNEGLLGGIITPFFTPSLSYKPPQRNICPSVYTKGQINDLANAILKAEPHHTNLITQKKAHADGSILPSSLLSVHQNEAALKWTTNLDYV